MKKTKNRRNAQDAKSKALQALPNIQTSIRKSLELIFAVKEDEKLQDYEVNEWTYMINFIKSFPEFKTLVSVLTSFNERNRLGGIADLGNQ